MSAAKCEQPRSHSPARTQLPDVLPPAQLGIPGCQTNCKASRSSSENTGAIAWAELCAAVITQLLLAKIFHFKSSSAVMYAIAQFALSAISIE